MRAKVLVETVESKKFIGPSSIEASVLSSRISEYSLFVKGELTSNSGVGSLERTIDDSMDKKSSTVGKGIEGIRIGSLMVDFGEPPWLCVGCNTDNELSGMCETSRMVIPSGRLLFPTPALILYRNNSFFTFSSDKRRSNR